ncbi:MAG: HDOD domain-containing protein [Gemmatimonadaceae bacterium]|jgi:EAL and modified HD-GYP domain-containing signal transduction protein|nr:HDOD domain-containing protein [Gemmatimonadaceae bacterium]
MSATPSCHLVRTPVFDCAGAVVGYELRFREGAEGRHAFAQSCLSGMFDIVRAGYPAFVRATRQQLLEKAYEMADPRALVLLIGPELQPEPELLQAIAAVKATGVHIALDEYSTDAAIHTALLPHVSMVRADLRMMDYRELGRLVDQMDKRDVDVHADFIMEQAQLDMAVNLGVSGLLGPYFSRPEALPAADVPASTLAAVRLMGLARDPNTNDAALEATIRIDPVLTFQLLRLVNSAALGGRGVQSIGHALRMIGRNAFLRWLAVAVAASRRGETGVDRELVRHAVERARFCEQMSGRGRDSGTLFLVGLFSLMDGVFRLPMSDLLERVPLDEQAKQALLDREGPYADALAIAESYELGMWESATEAAKAFGVEPDALAGMYANALQWATEQLQATMEAKGMKAA